MKNIVKTFFLTLLIFVSFVFATSVFAQDPPPPPGDGHGGGGSLPPGGGAPVGEGSLFIDSLLYLLSKNGCFSHVFGTANRFRYDRPMSSMPENLNHNRSLCGSDFSYQNHTANLGVG